MSDFASPILYIMQDEGLAFWCFVNLMEKMGPNFSNDSSSMNLQLAALERLLQLVDPDLHAFIEAADSSNYFFCYRWLLVHFKREFTFDEVRTPRSYPSSHKVSYSASTAIEAPDLHYRYFAKDASSQSDEAFACKAQVHRL